MKISRYFISFASLAVLVLLAVPVGKFPIFAQTSNEYLPNYGLSQTWENITTNFITIQATKKRWDIVPAAVFSSLLKDFTVVFPQLPQRNNYRIVYDVCKSQAQKLATTYSSLDFDIFFDQCQWPLNTIMKEINANYTIKAISKASPQSWSAPLTVTLDARSSTDPSNDTIPSNNFYRYYKNTDGVDVVIGRWAVISYTFEQEGTYYVHLTAKSANKPTEGILDGSATTIITVAPEIANLVVYANGKRLQEKTYTKIGTTEARNGVVFDGSATLPKWGREILSHSREIVGANGYKYTSNTVEWRPGNLTQQLPDNGSYTIKLSLTDNENNTIVKTFLVAVSDPIAIIKQNPETITTTTQVSFDAWASYSINSRIKRYNWEIYNDKWDREVVSQQKTVTHKFTKPGSYTVKLTVTDELNEINTETKTIEVESTPPQAQFTITPRLDWEHPSQFVLDATSSFDVDVSAELDALTYERSFSNPSLTKVEQTYDNGQSIVASFNEPWKHVVTLTLKDSFGKISVLKRDIDVKSSLRPIILVNPRANSRGNTTRFMVTSNIEILNYERDFGDGQKEIVSTSNTTHIYKTSGVYNVKLTATDKRGNTNSISTMVFVGNKDMPIGAYTILNNRQNILRADQKCNEKDAYLIKRWEKFSINTNESVNTKGVRAWLLFYFTPQNDEIYKSTNFSYSFRNVWCQKIDILVEDTLAGKTDTQTVWFSVVNNLPKLDSIGMFFPQFGNEVGIGLNQSAKDNVFNPQKYNQLTVKVTANNAKDMDGSISQYVWYYYKTDDPTKIISIKSTPGNVPYTFFSIDTKDPLLWWWNITFGVKLIDNDAGEMYSEQIVWQGPTFFMPPCTTAGLCDQAMDVPIVTLTTDKTDISVGDTVKFVTKARTLSNRPDFDSQRVVRYDFDGDGTWDLTTKALEVEYVYTKPSDGMMPSVEVTYRKNTVKALWPEITIKKDLKVKLESAIQDKTVYLRDYSYGDISKKEVCFDLTRECKTNNNEPFLSYTYETYGEKTIKYTIYDNYGNKAVGLFVVDLKAPTSTWSILDLISIPKSTINDQWRYVISIANDQQNKVFINAKYAGDGTCFIDKDINDDSNYDGKTDNDKDILCNSPKYIELDPYTDEINGRVIYSGQDNTLIGHGIVFKFTEQTVAMTQSQKQQYNKILNLMKSLPSANDDQKYIKTLLQEMADNVKINKNQTETIINLRVFLESTKAGLTDAQLQSIQDLIKEFETSDTIAFDGGTIVDQVRQFLIDYAPWQSMKTQISDAFGVIQALPEPAAQPEVVKTQLALIGQIFQDNSVTALESQNPWNEEKIIRDDIETQITPRICEVLNYYEIVSEKCPNADNIATTDSSWQTSVMGTVLKWVAIVVGVLWWIFLLIVIFFAVKARLQQNADETAPPSA